MSPQPSSVSLPELFLPVEWQEEKIRAPIQHHSYFYFGWPDSEIIKIICLICYVTLQFFYLL